MFTVFCCFCFHNMWYSLLKGERGVPGVSGEPGPAGQPGAQGPEGGIGRDGERVRF